MSSSFASLLLPNFRLGAGVSHLDDAGGDGSHGAIFFDLELEGLKDPAKAKLAAGLFGAGTHRFLGHAIEGGGFKPEAGSFQEDAALEGAAVAERSILSKL